MNGMQPQAGEKCPFSFNFDPQSFQPGDWVSYRVESMGDFPFAGRLVEVHGSQVLISPADPTDPDRLMRGTRESRPVVNRFEALGAENPGS